MKPYNRILKAIQKKIQKISVWNNRSGLVTRDKNLRRTDNPKGRLEDNLDNISNKIEI